MIINKQHNYSKDYFLSVLVPRYLGGHHQTGTTPPVSDPNCLLS